MMLSSCQDIEEYFETPSWIGGSIYECLQDDGNYNIFLKGVEMSGYQPIVDGKSILTVMAPNDDAMRQYLKDNYGTESIENVPVDEVKKLVGFHILYYAFDKTKLMNFRPNEGDQATEEEKNENAGLYYKFRTRSQDPLSYKNTETKDTAIYHFERLMPVFSHYMFRTKGIDAKKNYEYFYPGTTWTGADGFNIANASVNEYAGTSTNGYYYKIDRVLKPTETIYKELQTSGKYTKFLAEYDKYGKYDVDDDLTREYGNGTTIYQHSYSNRLPNIDCEWPTTDYQQISQMALSAFSVFAPTDKAWNDFFNDYWHEGGYESLDDVDSTAIADILFNSVCSQSIVFPEEINNGTVLNPSNEVISFNTDEIGDRIVCTNGVLYGCDVLTPPAKYISVTGPVYQKKMYSNFAMMVNNSGLANTLTAQAVKYIMFHADNDQMEQYGRITREGSNLTYVGEPNSRVNASPYVYAHVATPVDGVTDIPTSGVKVYRCLSPDRKLYWYVKDGKITNSIKFTEMLDYPANPVTDKSEIWANFDKLAYRGDVNGWTNGNAYSYDRNFFEGDYSRVNNSRLLRLMYQNMSEPTTDFYGFIKLLSRAGAVNNNGVLSFTVDECLMFVPTTDALKSAIAAGRIPGVSGNASDDVSTFFDNCTITDADALTYYLRAYFVPMTTAVVTNYPYLGWGENTENEGGLITCQTDETTDEAGSISITETRLNIYDDGTKLSVGLVDRATGATTRRVNVSSKYDYLPLIFEDGAAHFITDVF